MKEDSLKLEGRKKLALYRCEYTLIEEILHSVTHGLGALASIVGLVFLVIFSARYGDPWHVVGFSLFGSSLLILYLVSTFYHALPTSKAKRIFRVLDHSAIYLTIAATYTPFILVSLRGLMGWSLFGIIWGLAIIGIILKCIQIKRFQKVSYTLYILMGWLCVVNIEEMLLRVPNFSLNLLVTGGIFYTVGFVFYAWDKLPYNHFIWHLFVIGGSVSHYFSVLSLV